MADIRHLLDKIRKAIYGKEVRGSLADGLEAVNNEVEDATEVAVNVEQRQDAVEQQFDDVLNEWTGDKPISNEETIAARTNRNTGENWTTIGERMDEENKNVTEQLAKIEYNAEKFGVASDGVTDDTQAVKNAINNLSEGDILKFNSGTVRLTSDIPIDKRIIIRGSGMNGERTVLEFDGCSGLILRDGQIHLEDIYISGVNKPEFNFENGEYGTIGIKNEFSPNYESGGTTGNNVRIRGFNIGLSMFPEGDLIPNSTKWAGAYRELFNFDIRYNDIGVLALDGATHNKFYGGNISANYIHGVYADAQNSFYNNLEFIGVSMEGNGEEPVYTSDHNKSWGVYCGVNTYLNFTNSYFEKSSVFADEGGTVILNSTYAHFNSPMFGRGTIVDNGIGHRRSFSYPFDLLNRVAVIGMEARSLSGNSPILNLKSNDYGEKRLRLPIIRPESLPAKSLRKIKLSFSLKINSGIESPDFGIKPLFRIRTRNTGDTSATYRMLPIDVFQPKNELGKWQNYTVFYFPRKSDGYLDGNELLTIVESNIYFTNSRNDGNADYSTDNLDIDIANVTTTLYTDTEFAVNDDLLHFSQIYKEQEVISGTVFHNYPDEESIEIKKNSFGQVSIRGNAYYRDTTTDRLIATLPPEARPRQRTVIPAYFTSTNETGNLILHENGELKTSNSPVFSKAPTGLLFNSIINID